MRFHESHAVIAAATAATVIVAGKTGALGAIPALGPVAAPWVTVALGVALATMVPATGTAGQAAQGVGYGLVALGVLSAAG